MDENLSNDPDLKKWELVSLAFLRPSAEAGREVCVAPQRATAFSSSANKLQADLNRCQVGIQNLKYS